LDHPARCQQWVIDLCSSHGLSVESHEHSIKSFMRPPLAAVRNSAKRLHYACISTKLHVTLPTNVTIRDVPDETRDELAARAALAGRSLQEHLRAELIELARRPSVAVLMDRVRARKTAIHGKLSAKQILRFRDSDRR
jgi:plasmid stability protein